MTKRTKLDLAKAHVLVVEDDADTQLLLVEILQSLGFGRISRARDGIRAWMYFEEGNHFDLVVCDWMMPGMDGLSVLKNIRRSHPNVPFIMLTARKTAAAVREAADCGVTAYITKPFTVANLTRQILAAMTTAATTVPGGDSWEI